MTALTARQIDWLKAELGEDYTTEQLQTRFDQVGSVRDVAVIEIRTRITRLVNSPMSFNLSGVAAVNFGENVKALERQLARLVKMDEDPSDNDAGGDTDVDALPVLVQRPFGRRRRR